MVVQVREHVPDSRIGSLALAEHGCVAVGPLVLGTAAFVLKPLAAELVGYAIFVF